MIVHEFLQHEYIILLLLYARVTSKVIGAIISYVTFKTMSLASRLGICSCIIYIYICIMCKKYFTLIARSRNARMRVYYMDRIGKQLFPRFF